MRTQQFAAIACCFLSSCSIAPPKPPDIRGAYARQLSPHEIDQIEAVVTQRSDIRKPIDTIEADRPNHAVVTTGPTYNTATGNLVKLSHRHGQWFITSVDEIERVIIVGPSY
jgi:hypothetical protein